MPSGRLYHESVLKGKLTMYSERRGHRAGGIYLLLVKCMSIRGGMIVIPLPLAKHRCFPRAPQSVVHGPASITWENGRRVESQIPPYAYWVRICILAKLPGRCADVNVWGPRFRAHKAELSYTDLLKHLQGMPIEVTQTLAEPDAFPRTLRPPSRCKLDLVNPPPSPGTRGGWGMSCISCNCDKVNVPQYSRRPYSQRLQEPACKPRSHLPMPLLLTPNYQLHLCRGWNSSV